MTARDLIYVFLIPSGRADRRGLLIAAGLLLLLQLTAVAFVLAYGFVLDGIAVAAFHAIFLWLAFVATSKRLHDLGLSAWWIAMAFLAVMVSTVILTIGLMFTLPQAAFSPGGLGYTLVMAGNIVPIFALTIWMHVKKASPGPNQYGPETGPSGFSLPSDAQATQTSPLAAEARR